MAAAGGGGTADAGGSAFGAAVAGASAGLAFTGAAGKQNKKRGHWHCLECKVTKAQKLSKV